MEEILERIKEFREMSVRHRKQSYSGKGRPKQSDYINLKIKDLADYNAYEILNSGFSTNYIK